MSLRLLPAAVLAFAGPAVAQDPKPADANPTAGRVTAVTVYQSTALVTREVAAPDAAGLVEIVVSPLPPATMPSSLYAEGADGIRVLSARYRTRAIAEDTREEVRALETKIKDLGRKLRAAEADLKAVELNAQFLGKLEGFTGATLTHLTDKGQLDSDKTIALVNFIRDGRAKAAKDEVAVRQAIEATQEEQAFAQRLLQEKAGGGSRTERDAVVVVDKARPGAGTVRLSYLVGNASWRPQYKLRAGARDKDPVGVEYLAAVTQQTGEDWAGVAVTLSTAQPLLNAAPPDLRALEVAVGPGGGVVAGQAAGDGGVPARSAYLRDLRKQSDDLRRRAAENLNNRLEVEGGRDANTAAALDQYRDFLVGREEAAKEEGPPAGPSVTYRLRDRLTLPSRGDDQVVEVARLELAPRFYYKAVPVLTPQVYRLADLVNTTDTVLLPGDATVYIGADFVGQTQVPLVAVGKPFTVGFGADPQLQVSRRLVDKGRTTQGGNQVLTFRYRTLLSSYKPGAVDVQVWDRMPHAEAQQTIAVTLTKASPEPSGDPLYVRDDRPRNLLRWDVKVDPKQNGEKALAIEYEFRLELALAVNIGAFQAK